VVGSFNRLRTHGDILGFHLGDHPDTEWDGWGDWIWDWEWHKHWQGIHRLMAGDGQYMVVTHDDAVDNSGEGWSTFAVVRMGSRNARGERYRSNRLIPEADFEHTVPPSVDVAVQTAWINDDEDHEHPGSVQAAGDILPVGTGDEVHFYDVGNPQVPLHKGPPDPNSPDGIGALINRPGKTGSSVAMAQLQDGRHLLMVADSDAAILDFYVLTIEPEGTTVLHLDEWRKWNVIVEPGVYFKDDWDTFQSLSLVVDCDTGKFYLIGMGNLDSTATCPPIWPCIPNGEDWASLYEVRIVDDPWEGPNTILIEKIAERHFYCGYRGERYCNFDAAGGVYVDPYGQLYLYSTEHTSDGPLNTVKFMEFRPVPHAPCTGIESSWVELYQDKYFGGRSLMIDYVDSLLKDYTDYDHVEDFEGRTSSVYWCLPPNWSYYLGWHKEPCRGFLPLRGTGSPWVIPDLHSVGWGGAISCSGYVYDPPMTSQITPSGGGWLLYNRPELTESLGAEVSAKAEGASTEVDVPPGAVDEPATLTYVPAYPPSHDTSPLVSPGYAFTLTIDSHDGLQEDFTFAQPVDVTITYEDADIEVMDEETFMLSIWDPDNEQWVDAATTCSPTSTYHHNLEENSLSVAICRVGEFAMVGERVYEIYLPSVLRGWELVLPRRVLFDEAHGERNTLSWDRALAIEPEYPEWVYFGALAASLEDEFVFERNPDAPLSPELLQAYDVLVLSAPNETIDANELEAVKQFVASGGGLLVLGDCGLHESVNTLTSGYGITFEHHCIFAFEQGGDFVVDTFADHPAMAGVSSMVTNWGGILAVGDSAVEFAFTGEDIWWDTNDDDEYDLGEPTGPFTIAAAYEAGRVRVVAVADNPFQDDGFEGRSNDVLMRALLKWLTGSRAP